MSAIFTPPQTFEDDKKIKEMLKEKTTEELNQWLAELARTIEREQNAYDNLGSQLNWFSRLFWSPPPLAQTTMGRVIDECLSNCLSIQEVLKEREENQKQNPVTAA